MSEEELMKSFSTAVSACVQGGLMTSQRAQSYCRSGETSGAVWFISFKWESEGCVQTKQTKKHILFHIFAYFLWLYCSLEGFLVVRHLIIPAYHPAVLDADLRFALETRPGDDVTGRCLVYVHKVVNDIVGEGRRPSSPPEVLTPAASIP